MADASFNDKVAQAITELAKGMKSITFYPVGHPALSQAITRIIAALEALPIPESGLEIEVSRTALRYDNSALPVGNKALADLNRELFLRRVSKIIILPGLEPAETITFLKILSRDAQDLLDEGGLERALLRGKVSRIWANRVDYEGLTEMLKREEEEPPPELAEVALAATPFAAEPAPPLEDVTLELLLSLIEKEADPEAYREHIAVLARMLPGEAPDRRVEMGVRALMIMAAHVDKPPQDNEYIAKLAPGGIRELANDELVAACVARLRDGGGRGRRELERILAAAGELAVVPLLDALSADEDLIVRKSIVDVLIRIGRPAVAPILERMADSRWFTVRNLVTILGSMGYPDLAPHVAAALSNPDHRVKKEAIKALSKIPNPVSVTALGDLCFHPDETLALTATAALSSKKEPEAVEVLFRRITRRKYLFPHYRLANEALDSLRAIGTEDAMVAMEHTLNMRFLWETREARAMKVHALRSVAKIPGERSRQIVERAAASPRKDIRWEAERILKRMGAPSADERAAPAAQIQGKE